MVIRDILNTAFKNTSSALLLGLVQLFAACEKEIELEPQSLDPVMVVEATIENDQVPTVFLTKSFNYFSSLTAAMLADAFVRNAVVKISDGQREVQLSEFSIPTAGGTVYYYSVSAANPANFMVGKLNTAYKLTIEAEGRKYEADTRILPLNKQIDSLWWQTAPNNPDTNKVVVFSRVYDPPGLGNYIRYFTKVGNSAFIPGFNSVFDDQVVDGITYNIQVFRGQDRNQPVNNEEFGYFQRGDTVDVKLSNIDKATFDFWRTWEQNQSNINNPFGVPVKILSNISNGAAGYFGGYASSVERLVIPK